MKRNDVAILDFGSSKIVCVIGCAVADDFVIKALGQSPYGGFCDGEWLEPEKIAECVVFAIKQAEKQYNHTINSLYVGVPGEFTNVSASQAELYFKTRKKISREDIAEIFYKSDNFKNVSELTPISRSVISYTLDDGKQTVDPVGDMAAKLSGIISYIFVNEYFTSSISSVLQSLNIGQTEFISNCLAEALFLLPPEERDKQAILIDVGYITTNVMLVKGDGLMFMKSFSMGGGHIYADLCKVMKMPYKQAEQLGSKVNLNLEFSSDDCYSFQGANEIKAARTNDIVEARIEDIASYIVKCFDCYDEKIPMSTPLYITGGGLTYIKGAVDYLAKLLHKKITVAKILDPLKNKPEYASAYGLVNIAVKQRANKRF